VLGCAECTGNALAGVDALAECAAAGDAADDDAPDDDVADGDAAEGDAAEGDAVELTFMMPAEITLTESMRVRGRGRVTRVMPTQSKFGVAVHIEGYEYLSEAGSTAQVSASFPRVSGAHDASQTRKNSSVPGTPTVAMEG